MSKNSFKELAKEDQKHFDEKDRKIKENINHSIGFLHFIGDMIELFVPRVVQIFLGISSAKGPKVNSDEDEGSRLSDVQDNPRYPNTLE